MSSEVRTAEQIDFTDKVWRLVVSLELTEGVWFHGAIWIDPTCHGSIGRDQGSDIDNWSIMVTPENVDEEQAKLDPTFADLPLLELRKRAWQHLRDSGAKEPWGGWDHE